MTASPITIIIPNFNGAQLLKCNLPSVLQAAEAYPGDVQVIVVDDASSDDSRRILNQDFPSVKTVLHEQNQGFAEAIHSGVRHAETELLFLLNSDVELGSGCVETLEPYFDDETTFSVCPLMLREDGSVNRHSWNLREFSRGYLKLTDWDLDEARKIREQHKLPTLYASGGSMMVSKSKFLALNGFHPIFKPFYGEDFDLGIRAWYRGWPSYFEPNATVIHQSQGSIKDNVKRTRVKETRRRNKYLIQWIHMPPLRFMLNTVPITALQLIVEVLTHDFVNIRGFSEAVAQLSQAMEARHHACAGRNTKLAQIIDKILRASTK